MIRRIAVVLAAAEALWAATASATPDEPVVTAENRVQLVAARMSQGESYDRATRAVPLPSDERSREIGALVAQGKTYREAQLAVGERAEIVNARWNKHLAAMVDGGAHEAGWVASTR